MLSIPARRRQRQLYFCESKDRLVYKASSRTGRNTQKKLGFEKNLTKTNQQIKNRSWEGRKVGKKIKQQNAKVLVWARPAGVELVKSSRLSKAEPK